MVFLSACGSVSQAPQRQTLQRSTTAFTPTPEARQCLAKLSAQTVGFRPISDAYYGAGCSTIDAVRLVSLRSDEADLSISNLGPVTCPLATIFAEWARYGVDRAARQILGSPLVRIETMGSYVCRNVAGTGRRSAHATANAIDVSGFDLADGRRITILGDWNAGSPQTRAFLRTIHTSACKRFGTVLGPGYNMAHRNHLHLELSHSAFCR